MFLFIPIFRFINFIDVYCIILYGMNNILVNIDSWLSVYSFNTIIPIINSNEVYKIY